MVQEKVSDKEKELKQEMDDRIRVYKETEYALERQLQQTKDQVISMQNSNDINQAKLSDNTQKFDDSVAAKLSELEIIVKDFEQAKMKIAEISRENQDLRTRLDGQNDLDLEQEYVWCAFLIFY